MDETMEYRVRALEEAEERNLKAHKEFFDKFDSINVAQTRIETQYASILASIAKIEACLEELRSKPAKRWESVVGAIATGVAGFLVAMVLKV